MEEKALGILRKYWGYESFRPSQMDVIRSAMEGRDTLAILPTGGGKSICFQVPGMMKGGLSIVVTPLIALMKDQVQNLQARGIKAIAVHAGMGRRDADLALNNAAYGDCRFLYVSPERLGTFLFRSYLQHMDVSFIVVDEAHCISQWGYDFRPDYLRIGEIREMTGAPVIALTATATPAVADDIMDRLGFSEKNVVRSGFERPNLSYVVRNTEDKRGQLLSICQGVQGSGIVYVRHRRKTGEVAAFLADAGISSSFYHAGLGHETREERQLAWKEGRTRVMVCTNAFGMGIDKPDVRFVVHLDLPDSPEAYFQEAGRAGRDGKPSYAALLWNREDIRRLKQIENVTFPSPEFLDDIYQKVHIFFRIPYGDGEGRSLKFDLDAFCSQFSLERSRVLHALTYLERADHWSYTRDVDTDTRVRILADRNALYDIGLPDERMPRLLDMLMRKYGCIFSQSVAIDEEFYASALSCSVPQFRELLYRMSLEHVLAYIPKAHSDVIFLHHQRYRPGDVNLHPELLDMLKGNYHARAEAMQEYVSDEGICRQRFLLEYFGQSSSSNCGRCDVCRSGNSRRRRTAQALVTHINLRLGGNYSLDDLRPVFGLAGSSYDPDYLSILRELIDEGKVPPYKDVTR